MQDQSQLEWSTETVGIVIALATALARAKISAPRKISNAAFLQRQRMNIPVVNQSWYQRLAPVVKLDITNTNFFLCNNFNGK